MNFLKSLFGGGSNNNKGDERGYYVYVKPKACNEILRIRIDLYNDLSREDSGDGYFVRKMASGHRCPFTVEMTLNFSGNRQLVNRQIENGEFVEESDWDAFNAERESST